MSGSVATTSVSSSSSSFDSWGLRRSSRTPVPSADLLAGLASMEEKKEKERKKERVVETQTQSVSSSSAAAAVSRAKKNDSPPASPKPGDTDQTPPIASR